MTWASGHHPAGAAIGGLPNGTKPTYEMVCYYVLGLASEADLLADLERLQPQAASQNAN